MDVIQNPKIESIFKDTNLLSITDCDGYKLNSVKLHPK